MRLVLTSLACYLTKLYLNVHISTFLRNNVFFLIVCEHMFYFMFRVCYIFIFPPRLASNTMFSMVCYYFIIFAARFAICFPARCVTCLTLVFKGRKGWLTVLEKGLVVHRDLPQLYRKLFVQHIICLVFDRIQFFGN